MYWLTLNMRHPGGAWVAQSVKNPTLDFSSGRVMRLEPVLGWAVLAHSRPLSRKKKEKKKKRDSRQG